jgi:hypothetical protein
MVAGSEGALFNNSLGRTAESYVGGATVLRRARGGDSAWNEGCLAGNGGAGGRRVFASAYWLPEDVRAGISVDTLRGGGGKSGFKGVFSGR